jgi:hypothetical protein
MFIFAFLNLICLTIILAKFIWHSEHSRTEFARNIDKLFGVPKREIEIIKEEQDDGEELNHTCDHCINGCDDEDSEDEDEDDEDHIDNSMPDLVESYTKQVELEDKDTTKEDESKEEESDDVSIEHVGVEDLEIIKETLGFIKKTKEMLFEIKNDLEKKID